MALAYGPIPALPETPPEPRGWVGRDDLVFFVGCYAAGLVFFLVMLS